jgi:hypothetical protein
MNTSSSTAAVNPIDSLIFSVADSNVHSLIVSFCLSCFIECTSCSGSNIDFTVSLPAPPSQCLGRPCNFLQKGAALGIALQGVLLGMIYSHSYRYFQIFNDSDPRLYRALVGVGIVVNT